jgi:membrane associated rhomboid family serine protease
MSARWFYRAPVSKALFYGTAFSSLVALKFDVQSAMQLDPSGVLASGQFWRLVAYQFPFSNLSEIAVGLAYLYELRKFERMMGNEKFGAFVLLVTTLSTTLLASLSLTFGEMPATGPFPLVAALLVLHHTFVPVTQPRMFRALGVNFTDKAPLYAFTLPVRLMSLRLHEWTAGRFC